MSDERVVAIYHVVAEVASQSRGNCAKNPRTHAANQLPHTTIYASDLKPAV